MFLSGKSKKKNLMLGHLYINSLRNKYGTMKSIIEDAFDFF